MPLGARPIASAALTSSPYSGFGLVVAYFRSFIRVDVLATVHRLWHGSRKQRETWVDATKEQEIWTPASKQAEPWN